MYYANETMYFEPYKPRDNYYSPGIRKADMIKFKKSLIASENMYEYCMENTTLNKVKKSINEFQLSNNNMYEMTFYYYKGEMGKIILRETNLAQNSSYNAKVYVLLRTNNELGFLHFIDEWEQDRNNVSELDRERKRVDSALDSILTNNINK